MKKYLLSLGLTFLSLWALARENPDAQAWLGRNGLTFTENKGQVFDALGGRRPDILYTAEANGVSLYFRHSGVSYVFPKLEDKDADGAPEITALYRMDLELVGANPTPKVASEAATDGLNNYYLPHAPEGITGVRSFRKITYQNVYPNIDLVFYATDENVLKYDFVVRPGGNPSDIRLKYVGAEKSAMAKGGALEVNVPLGKIVEEAPVTFQRIDGKQQPVSSQFRLDGNVVTFEVGAYDKNQTLVIDPLSRQWATFYGSTNLDRAYGVTNDGQGRVTVTGITQNAAFPVTVGNNMPQTVFGGINDAFATQFDANSGARLWSTFYGGSAIDQGLGIATDKFRNVYITGYTTSTNFPTQAPTQATQGGGGDAFVVKLNQNGARQWASYYGGSGIDQANGIASDMDGNVFISGMTFSSNLNVPGAGQGNLASTGFRDAFLTKFNGANGAVIWGTYYGGTGDDQGWGLAVTASGDPVITGQTNSTNLPLSNAFQSAINGGLDAFVAKYNGGTGARLMSTYYGGNKDDHGSAVAIDGAGNAYIVGYTVSDNLFTPNAFQSANASSGLRDGFIARINANNSLQWASYMGGSGNDEANAVACFSSGQVYVAGLTSSANFPMLDSPIQSSLAGNNDMFVMGVTANGVALNSTYYGGSGNDFARAVSGSASGALYVVGQTSSKNFPTQNAFQSQLNGNGQGSSDDAFVIRFNGAAVCPTLTVTPTVTNIVCKGAATGGISLSLSGATGPFSFAWTGPNNFASVAQNISGLFAGSYTGVITYNNGTCTASATVTVTEPATGIMLDAVVTDVQCNGGNTGAISLDATGGSAPYTFMWTGPNGFTGNTANITGLMAGIYSGKVTDASGCSVTADVPVEQGPAINVAVDQLRNVSCGSGSDGAILISVSGGTGPYSFVWTGPNGFTATTEDILGLRAGDYNGQITDAAGCVLNAPVTVQDGPQIVVTLENKKDVTCNGGSDGAIDISVSGGLAPYTFNWSGPNNFIATTEDISGLMAGNYVGVVIDANGCIVNPIPQVLIDQPVALSPSVSTNDPLLFCDNKSAVLMASPTSGVTYQWLMNGSPIAGAIDMTYVATMAGDFAVRVTNANGCNAQSAPLTLSTIPAPTAVISSFDQLIFCDGGSATLNLTSDAASWTWLFNGGPVQSDGASFTALLEGEYSVRAVAANGCDKVSNILTTIVYPLPTADVVPPGTVSLCEGEELQLEGMTDIGTNYQWQLNGIDIAGANNQKYTIPATAAPGVYNYTVTVLNNITGCVRQSLATIVTVNVRPTVSLSVSGDVTYCSNAVTPIDATVTNADMIEWWLNGAVVASGVTSFGPSESGVYMVKVTNSTTGCTESTATVNVTINPAPVVMVDNMGPVVTCMNNLVTITASGGDTYQWSLNGTDIVGATNASITPDASGDYMVMATFTATGCSETSAPINFTVNPMMVIDAGTDVIICEGDAVSLGNAVTVASGGNGGPYTYTWAPAGSLNDATAANPVATPVVPTTYTLTVTDGPGNCMAMDQVIVFVNPSPKPVVTAGGVTLFCEDGTVQLTSVTPAPPTPSTYQWFRDADALTGATSPDYTVSMVGTAPTFANNYYLEVTGNNGCVGKSNMVSVTVYPDPDVTLTASGPLTFCDGSSVTFTAPAYTPDALTNLVYQWFKDGNPIDGATSDNYTASVSGAYFVNIKNTITGCEENSATQNVVVNPNPVADAGADMDLCLNGTPMMMGGSPAATGGTPGYTYSWAPTMGFDDPTLANPMLTQMASGTVIYTLTVTDVNGCMGTDEAIVLLKPNPVVTISAEFDRNKICDDGFINLTANVAPVPSYGIANYKWTNVTTGAVISEGPAVTGITISDLVSTVNENYEALISVEITSTDGCKGTSPDYNVTVFPNPNTTVTTTGSVSSCFGLTDLTISVPLPASASVLDAQLVYTWYRNGIIFKTGVATDAGINSYTLPANEPVGAHNYFVNIKNTVTGCEENTVPVFVTVYANPVANAGSDKTTCEGDNITLDGSASGGTTAAYLYSWTPASLLSDATTATPTFLSPDPDATGSYSYSLIVSQDNSGTVCSSTADDVTVTVNQKPDVAITLQSPNDKLIFCEGGFVTMVASNTNGAVTVASYQWYKNGVAIAGAISATYSTQPSEGLNAAGDYVCEITSTEGCKRLSDVQTVQVSALPIAVITRTSPAPYCEGLQNVLSADDAGNDPSIMIYEWRLNSVPLALNTGVAGDNVTITVTAPGNYEVLVSNSITNCKALSAPVPVYANPVADAGPDFTVCPDKATAITVVNGSASGGDGVYTYDWTGSAAAMAYLSPTNIATPNFQQSAYMPGVYAYTLTVTDGKGCINSDIVDVTVSDFATVGVVETEPSGCGTSDGVLAISVSGGKSPYTYRVFNALNLMYPEVTDPSATYNYTGLPSGDYTVKVIDADGCEMVFAGSFALTVQAPVFTVLQTSTDFLDLAWTNVSGATYEIRYRIIGEEDDNWQVFTGLDNTSTAPGATQTPSRRFLNLQNNTEYEFEIKAMCSTGEISPTTIDTFTTDIIPGLCPPPGGVFVNQMAYEAVNNFTSADVYWNLDVDAVAYDLEIRLQGTSNPTFTSVFTCIPASFLANASTVPGKAIFPLSNLFENSIYDVRVRKYCGPCTNSGLYSDIVTFETGGNCSALTTAFDAVANKTSACSDEGINLSLNLPSGLQPNLSFLWERSTDINGPYSIAQGTTDQPTYTATEVGTFFYRCEVTVGTCAPVASNPVVITVFEQPQVIAQVNQPLSCAASSDASIIAGCLPFGNCNPNDFEFSIDGISYQPNGFGGQFDNLGAGDYTVFIRNITTQCVGTFPISITFSPAVQIQSVDLVGVNRARATWTASPNAVKYQIRWRVIGSGDDGWASPRDADEDAANASLDGPTVPLDLATAESMPAATGAGSKGLRSDGQYEVQMRVMCAGNVFSAWSLPFPFSTDPISATCGTVGSLYVDTDVTQAVINWTEPSASTNAPICYQIRYRQTGSTVPFTTITSSTTQAIITGLLAGTSYDVQVRAICAGTCANPSQLSAVNSIRFQTQLFKDAAVSVNQNDAMFFSVYPNPNRGNFTVSFETMDAGAANLKVTDMTGRVIFEKSYNVIEGKNELPVEVSTYSAGVYLLQFQQGEQTRTTKLILN